ncbi:MAG TPA: peptidoglycan-binding domain-containing protein [Chthoniobacterales bacterium]|jgi:peptidoglycan hydrolase-like protein with peptidoglycan-binding domain|nr:peptidoglycan-binding domain-containing protein [Chthoniobacterales bacterium]
MTGKIATVILAIALVQATRADSTVQEAQQELKEQGYYFGQISGEKDADTTAAIRRFQIRSGLPITGELDEQTLRTLRSGTASSSAPTNTPQSERRENNETEQSGEATPPPREMQAPRAERAPSQATPSIFSNTPYEMAPPELQQRVIFGAQTMLWRRGFYKGVSDGIFSPSLEFSIRAFQSRLGIAPTGRLDMETLAALGLLPGPNGHPPMGMPRRRFVPAGEPPVRGEWIH